MLRIDVVTLFPQMISQALQHSIVSRAIESNLLTINVIDLRDFTHDRHRTADDTPYGGGGGMVMKIEPIAEALVHLGCPMNNDTSSGCGIISRPRVILTDPRGKPFRQTLAREWAREQHIVILCGHYEGVDERVSEHLVTDSISIGDYVLTGGELPALVIVDALTRLQSGALGGDCAAERDSFAEELLEYPQYTKPAAFNGWVVPDMLLCGHHALINRWRRWHQLRSTMKHRPDMFCKELLSATDINLLDEPEPVPPATK